MTLFKAAILGVCAMLLSLSFKPFKGEYASLISLCASAVIFTLILSKLGSVISLVDRLGELISINRQYIGILVKIIGISYICEFASSLCKDAGCGAIASQIEIGGKLTILVMSMPVFFALIDTIGSFLK